MQNKLHSTLLGLSIGGLILATALPSSALADRGDRGGRGGGNGGGRVERGGGGGNHGGGGIGRGGGNHGGGNNGGGVSRPSRPDFPRADRPSRPEMPRADRPSRPDFPRADRPQRPEMPRADRPSRPDFPRADRPQRPEVPRVDKPNRPTLPDRPSRPDVPRTNPDRRDRPQRPDMPRTNPDRRDDRRDGRVTIPRRDRHTNDGYRRDNRYESRRTVIVRHRDSNRSWYDRHRSHRHNARHEWRHRHNVIRHIVHHHWVHDHNHWRPRYTRWYGYCVRPVFYVVVRPISWYVPMPSRALWSYVQVESVAANLENLTHEIYAQVNAETYNLPDYTGRVLPALAQLAYAAETFEDTVDANYDFVDSINELFYLESMLDQAEIALRLYPRSYVVDNEMRALRYYVNELLWIYRQNF